MLVKWLSFPALSRYHVSDPEKDLEGYENSPPARDHKQNIDAHPSRHFRQKLLWLQSASQCYQAVAKFPLWFDMMRSLDDEFAFAEVRSLAIYSDRTYYRTRQVLKFISAERISIFSKVYLWLYFPWGNIKLPMESLEKNSQFII